MTHECYWWTDRQTNRLWHNKCHTSLARFCGKKMWTAGGCACSEHSMVVMPMWWHVPIPFTFLLSIEHKAAQNWPGERRRLSLNGIEHADRCGCLAAWPTDNITSTIYITFTVVIIIVMWSTTAPYNNRNSTIASHKKYAALFSTITLSFLERLLCVLCPQKQKWILYRLLT